MRIRISLVKRIKYAYDFSVMQSLSRRIKAIRSRLGENQTVFARRFGVDQSTVSKWEHGAQTPESRALDLLALLEEEAGRNGRSDSNSGSLFTLVPVTGEIGAGAAVYDVDGGNGGKNIGFERAPRAALVRSRALRVRGDSMYPVYRSMAT